MVQMGSLSINPVLDGSLSKFDNWLDFANQHVEHSFDTDL